MSYKCLNKNTFTNGNFQIKPISIDDIESIRLWRNMQMDVLRQKKEISVSQQIDYFNSNIKPTFNQDFPNQVIFSYFKNNVLIGYGGLVHISWEDKRSEMSFLLNPKYISDNIVYANYFLKFIHFMKDVNFDILKFHRIFTETYSHRIFHIEILEKGGFKLEGILRDHNFLNNQYTNSLIHSIIKDV
ncbi:GNAT family N-acetyltransferase [Aquirufa lenticrescens]